MMKLIFSFQQKSLINNINYSKKEKNVNFFFGIFFLTMVLYKRLQQKRKGDKKSKKKTSFKSPK